MFLVSLFRLMSINIYTQILLLARQMVHAGKFHGERKQLMCLTGQLRRMLNFTVFRAAITIWSFPSRPKKQVVGALFPKADRFYHKKCGSCTAGQRQT